MFVVHRVVNGHPQFHSTDIPNTSLGRILQNISCVLQSLAILGLDSCIQSSLQNAFYTEKIST